MDSLEKSIQPLLEGLKSYDDFTRKRSIDGLSKLGEKVFDHVASLRQHEVARWEVLSLLPRLSPRCSLPYLLEAVNYKREKSVQEQEHAKKYFRMKAIEELGKLGTRATPEILSLFAKHQVEDALYYFIDPAHPHLEEEVIEAVLKALKQIPTPQAKKMLEHWEKQQES